VWQERPPCSSQLQAQWLVPTEVTLPQRPLVMIVLAVVVPLVVVVVVVVASAAAELRLQPLEPSVHLLFA
jgi:hypothetical protein